MPYGLIGLAFFGFWLFCVLDVVMADAMLVRNLPKLAWLLLVVLVPTVGGIAWLVAGRPAHARFVPGSTERRPSSSSPRRVDDGRAARGPDDDPEFLRRLDERLRRRDDD